MFSQIKVFSDTFRFLRGIAHSHFIRVARSFGPLKIDTFSTPVAIRDTTLIYHFQTSYHRLGAMNLADSLINSK